MGTMALFIGRFQPFHRGHLDAVREIEKQILARGGDGEIVFVIGRPVCQGPAGLGRDYRHLWGFEEVKRMIQDSCEEIRTPLHFILAPDLGVPERYQEYILGLVGKAFPGNRSTRVVFSGNNETLNCFRIFTHELTIHPMFLHGTEIRLMILSDILGLGTDCWRNHVTKGSEKFLSSWVDDRKRGRNVTSDTNI
jgi:nicotinamide mononucleotide adenylyltransferase